MKKYEAIKGYLAMGMNVDDVADRVGTSRTYVLRLKKEMREKGPESPKTKIGVLSDIHAPYQDDTALKTAVKALKGENIDELILLGDVVDFYRISSFKHDLERMSFNEEVERAKEVLAYLTNEFIGTRITYVEGNHEARLRAYLVKNAPELAEFSAMDIYSIMGLDEFGIDYVDNIAEMSIGEPPLTRGKLCFLHGHEVRMGFSSVNLPRLMFQKTKANTIFGHFHKNQDFVTKDIYGKMYGCWSVGCLCSLSEAYLPINEWSHGFAIVTVANATGNFTVNNRLIYNGEVL